MAGLDFNRRYFVDPPDRKTRRYLAEYLIEYRRRGDDDSGKEVVYRLEHVAPGYENIVTRLATHSDKVRLHRYRHTETITTIGSSPMNDLHARLALAIYSQDERCPQGFNRKDWKKNLLRAKDLIGKRKLTTDDIGEITTAIIPRRREKDWRKQLCGWCHTPLLVGHFLDGRQITRAKEFCSDACKMNWTRRVNHPVKHCRRGG
jgi:hypothetical protein